VTQTLHDPLNAPGAGKQINRHKGDTDEMSLNECHA
jgi:hypothetical protein